MGNTQNSVNNKLNKDEESDHKSNGKLCRVAETSKQSTKAKSIESDLSKTSRHNQKNMHRFQWLGQANKAYIVGNFSNHSSEVTIAMEYNPSDKSFYVEVVC